MLLSNDDVPLVTSVSYGWQGDLKQIGCKEDDVTDVDNDFAKLAAKGITIIFASGDSGSGYAPIDQLAHHLLVQKALHMKVNSIEISWCTRCISMLFCKWRKCMDIHRRSKAN